MSCCGRTFGEQLRSHLRSYERLTVVCAINPGFVLSVKALLDEIPDPSDDEIREYLSGNLCRCAGYADILRAVRVAQVSSKLA